MKRLLLLLALCLLISSVSATTYNFAEKSDYFRMKNYSIVDASADTHVEHYTNASAQNSYVMFYGKNVLGGGDDAYANLRLYNPYPMSYSAVTRLYSKYISYDSVQVRLYSSDLSELDVQEFLYSSVNPKPNSVRYELKMLAGVPQYWENGVLKSTGPLLSGNPAYVSWGQLSNAGGVYNYLYLDDYNYAEPNRMQMTLPGTDNNTFIILKDIINPAASGIVFGENGTIVDSNYMYGSWSRGNASTDYPLDTQPNWTIQLKNYDTGIVYATNYTGSINTSTTTPFAGQLAWNIRDLIIENATAPQGYYGLYCPETLDWSNRILYKSNGASVAWNSKSYSHGDTASVIYYVLSGGYWDTSTYSYKIAILDSYYNFKENMSLTASSGTVTHSWADDDAEGVYHAWLVATSNVGQNEYILGDDYTNLVAYFGYGGYVNDGYTGLPISDAAVNITQGTSISNQSSGSDGNYTSQKLFATGASVFFNATKPGYNPYQYSFVPLASKSVYDLNVTIYPSDPVGSTGGIAFGGVVRDITYGRPIKGATVYTFNQSTSEVYTNFTNVAGGYICSVGNTCSLVQDRKYWINASKLGYNTSINYPVIFNTTPLGEGGLDGGPGGMDCGVIPC